MDRGGWQAKSKRKPLVPEDNPQVQKSFIVCAVWEPSAACQDREVAQKRQLELLDRLTQRLGCGLWRAHLRIWGFGARQEFGLSRVCFPPRLTARVDAEKAERQEAEERAGDKLETLQERCGRGL